MSDYDTDVVTWSETQAALLRRLASGERVNDIDWANIIEEIESVGLSELHAVRSLLLQALLHWLKLQGWPASPAAPPCASSCWPPGARAGAAWSAGPTAA